MVVSLKNNINIKETDDSFIYELNSSFNTVFDYLNFIHNEGTDGELYLYDFLSSLLSTYNNFDGVVNISDYTYTNIGKDYTLTKYVGDDAVVIVPNVKE